MQSDTLKAIEAGRYDEAAQMLLARWRARPQPEIATALDLVSAKIGRPPIPGDSVAERHAEWIAIAQQRDAADVPRLLTTMLDGTSSGRAQARIEVLVEGGPDPRVAAALVEIVKAQTLFVTKSKFWAAVLDGVARMRDVRQIEPLRTSIPPNRGYGGDWFIDLPSRLYARLPRIIEQLEAVEIAPTSIADDQRITAITKRLGTQVSSEHDLLDAVLENPADDAVRLVYADSLIARGDGRGELIVTQIKRAQGAKITAAVEAKLVRAHRAAVLGPLAPVVHDPVIERGFLTRCRIEVQPAQRALLQHRWWRTVEDVATPTAELVVRDDLPLLWRVWIYDDQELLSILRGRRSVPHVRALRVPPGFAFGANGVANSEMFPNLTCLEIGRHPRNERSAANELGKILGGRLGEKVEEIVVHSIHIDCPLELDAWRKVSKIERVRFELPYMKATFTRNKLEVELLGGGAATALSARLEAVKQRPEIVILKAPRGANLAALE